MFRGLELELLDVALNKLQVEFASCLDFHNIITWELEIDNCIFKGSKQLAQALVAAVRRERAGWHQGSAFAAAAGEEPREVEVNLTTAFHSVRLSAASSPSPLPSWPRSLSGSNLALLTGICTSCTTL